MSIQQKSNVSFASRGITLNSLKEELYSLNMRMLLAIQNQNEEMQKELKKEMARVQEEIAGMNLAIGRQHSS